jgi:hypothetical protein
MAFRLTAPVCLAVAAAFLPQAASGQELPPARAAGGELFYSSDSDDTEIVRAAAEFDLRHQGEARRLGVRVEKAWYDFAGAETDRRERVFLQAADTAGNWSWQARVGTDGHTVIGALSAHDDAPVRKEVFLERDVVETPQGLARGLYSTFAGAAIDLPADERNVFTALAAVQAFTGDNVRFHLRGNYVHVIEPELGLSVQLRGRYFRSSHPGEFDYYSPKWYAQVLPVVQMRRFVDGWQLLAAAGIGAQRDSASSWRRAGYAHARFRSPPNAANWSVTGEATYTQSPSDSAASGPGYSYLQTRIGVLRRF